ncbi:MAG: hypothetical protein HY907_11755 [Deltaproteobacteria bacterium]|nr:hypothetical protein [Deltaproteobacteria bacterium]
MNDKRTAFRTYRSLALLAVLAAVLAPARASAHCDTMSGPVITAAQQALETDDVDLVLVWVQPGDEAPIREEFEKAVAARRGGGAGAEEADRRFFEVLVRIHREGEGAAYSGIKPAGAESSPAVAEADRALVTGDARPLQDLVADAVRAGLARTFGEALERRDYDRTDVAAGRAYVGKYVAFLHFAEGLYDTATTTGPHHGHAREGDGSDPDGHAGHGEAGSGDGHAVHSGHLAHLPWILVAVFGLAVVGETSWVVLRRRVNRRSQS